MISVSKDFKNALKNDNRKYLVTASIKLADETVINVDNSNIWSGGLSFSDATSEDSSFQIGSAIINSMTLILDNGSGTYSGYDFYDAYIELKIGLKLSDTNTEYFRKGFYTVVKTTYNGTLITLNCEDNMWKFDKDFSNVSVSAPAKASLIVASICSYCGVQLSTATFPNSDLVITSLNKEKITCREALSYIAQMCCCYARINNNGSLILDWYIEEANESSLDGGIFDHYSPYGTGDSADGGNFTDWTSGDTYDGGLFTSKSSQPITSLSNEQIATDLIVPTGIKVVYGKEDSEYVTVGNNNYVITIKDNAFITDLAMAQLVAYNIGYKLIGYPIRKYNISALDIVYYEVGDKCIIRDHKGHQYESVITRLDFTIGSYETFACGGTEPMRNNVVHYDKGVKQLAESREITEEQISSYDKVVQNMTSLAVNSMGYYQTVETQEDGSTITYLHNKPDLDDSMTIYKMTVDGFFISTDGGTTYTSGFDSDGNVLVNILSAIGIRFDWARGGTLSLGGENNQNGEIFIYDKDGVLCGKINNNGISLWSDITGRQIILSPLLGLVQRDADGNEFYGLIKEDTFVAFDGYEDGYSFDIGYYIHTPVDLDNFSLKKVDYKYEYLTYYKFQAKWSHVGIAWNSNSNYDNYPTISEEEDIPTKDYIYKLPTEFKNKVWEYSVILSIDETLLEESINRYFTERWSKTAPCGTDNRCRAEGSGSSYTTDWTYITFTSVELTGIQQVMNYTGTVSSHINELQNHDDNVIDFNKSMVSMYSKGLSNYEIDEENAEIKIHNKAYVKLSYNMGTKYIKRTPYYYSTVVTEMNEVGYYVSDGWMTALIPAYECLKVDIKVVC